MMNEFTELAKAKINDKRNLVISKNNKLGGYTLAQQVLIQEGTKRMSLFIKNAIHINTQEGLYNLRDALNEALLVDEVQEDETNVINI